MSSKIKKAYASWLNIFPSSTPCSDCIDAVLSSMLESSVFILRGNTQKHGFKINCFVFSSRLTLCHILFAMHLSFCLILVSTHRITFSGLFLQQAFSTVLFQFCFPRSCELKLNTSYSVLSLVPKGKVYLYKLRTQSDVFVFFC